MIPSALFPWKKYDASAVKVAAVPIAPNALKHSTEIVEHKKDFQRFYTENDDVLTSMANSMPPIGAPNVAATPTATAAVKN